LPARRYGETRAMCLLLSNMRLRKERNLLKRAR
jgi:hypothetical protein